MLTATANASLTGRLRELTPWIAACLAFVAVARATDLYFAANGLLIPVFQPVAGLALGVLLLLGLRTWPALLVGALAANAWHGHPMPLALALSAGVVASALLGAVLLTRKGAFDPAIVSFRDYARLVFLGGVVAAGACAGVAWLALQLGEPGAGRLPAEVLLRWWMGQVAGVLIVTPLLLVWRTPPAAWQAGYRPLQVAAYFAVSFLAGQILFVGWLAPVLGKIALGYWMFLFIVWGAAQFGSHAVVIVLFMVAVQALSGAAIGGGFFGSDIARTQLSNFWFYLVALSTVGMGLASAVTAFKRAEMKVRDMALHDPLTGLPNRLLLSDRIGLAITAARRSGGKVAIVFHDLDNFKPVNDRFGHRMGDLLLKAVGERVRACVRDSDTVGRIGGDEFVIVLPAIASLHDVMPVAEKIRQALARPFVIESVTIGISTSLGVAIYPDHGADESSLTVNADNAMYHAKLSGRNNIQVFEPRMVGAARLGADGR